jgi:hypothetical protein
MHQILDPELDQFQDGVGQITSQNLRVRLIFQLADKVLLGVQPEAFSRSRPSRSTSTLLSASLGDGRDKQGFDSNTRIVHLLLEETGVNHVDDSVNSKRCLRDVGRYNDLASGWALSVLVLGRSVEDTLLLLRWEGRVERYDQDGPGETVLTEFISFRFDPSTRILNLLFSGQEQQDISGVLGLVNHQRRPDRGFQVIGLGFGRVISLDGERPSRDLHDGSLPAFRPVTKVLGEFLDIERGTHDDNLQVGSSFCDIFEETHQDVGSEGAFVRFVQDDGTITFELRIVHGLSEQHSVRHVFKESRASFGHVFETDRISDLFPKGHCEGQAWSSVVARRYSDWQSCSPSISSATRLATLIAATRRGWVHATILPFR